MSKKTLEDRMKTEFHTVPEMLEREEKDGTRPPLDLAVIPNHMGINLCSVEGMTWTRQADGQLVSLTIHFVPGSHPLKPPGRRSRKRKR